MEFNDLINRFYQFEQTHQLFERKDEHNTYYWDVFRYGVFSMLMFEGQHNDKVSQIPKVSVKDVLDDLGNLLKLCNPFSKRYKYLSIICPRNRDKDTNLFFDLQHHALINMVDKDDLLIYETFKSGTVKTYSDKNVMTSSALAKRFLKGKMSTFDFSSLCKEVNEEFPQLYLDTSWFSLTIQAFYNGKCYYTKLFNKYRPERIFLTQNGIRKDAFSAAHDLNIPIYEFQHGVIHDGHLAYSYPKIKNLEGRVHLADKILKLGDFWLNDCHVPYAQQVTVGNEFFCPDPNISKSIPDPNKVLVISADVIGESLVKFMIDVFENTPELKQFEYVFKLHPNQYHETDKYREYFKGYSNVIVATSEKSVQQWMKTCSSLMTIMSTACFEALQCGRKAIILKQGAYQSMQVLFGLPNVSTISTGDELLFSLQAPISPNTPEFFAQIRPEVLKSLL